MFLLYMYLKEQYYGKDVTLIPNEHISAHSARLRTELSPDPVEHRHSEFLISPHSFGPIFYSKHFVLLNKKELLLSITSTSDEE